MVTIETGRGPRPSGRWKTEGSDTTRASPPPQGISVSISTFTCPVCCLIQSFPEAWTRRRWCRLRIVGDTEKVKWISPFREDRAASKSPLCGVDRSPSRAWHSMPRAALAFLTWYSWWLLPSSPTSWPWRAGTPIRC